MSKLDLRPCIKRVQPDIWKNTMSQNAEDITIKIIADAINISESDRIAVDVGSWDGIKLSNIYNLLTVDNWGGILIEGNLNKIERSRKNFAGRSNIRHHHGFVDLEENGINDILAQHNCPIDFGVFNLDIDSWEFWVWKDLTYKPKIVCIEHNGNILNEDKVVAYDTNWKTSHVPGQQDNYGAGAKSLLRLGNHKGYDLVAASVHNLIFVRNDVSEKFEIINEIDVDYFKNVLGCYRNPERQRMVPSCFTFHPSVD